VIKKILEALNRDNEDFKDASNQKFHIEVL
jgi:hypothetical protein